MTAIMDRHKLIQVEMAYHGVYPYKIDGIWGVKSQIAMNQYKRQNLTPYYINLHNYIGFLWTGNVPVWFRAAWEERMFEVAEIPGLRNHPDILKYGETVDLKIDNEEIPWCSAFVNWCVQKSDHEGTNKANARSWLQWGKPILEPTFGCVVIFARPPHPESGHVGFYVTQQQDEILVLGGNQSNQVNISRYPLKNLLGYRTL